MIKISADGSAEDRKALSMEVEAERELLDQYLMEATHVPDMDAALTDIEWGAVKTYLMAKLLGDLPNS